MIGMADAFRLCLRGARRSSKPRLSRAACIASHTRTRWSDMRDAGAGHCARLACQQGPRAAPAIVSSACHGIEVIAAGVQVFALHDAEWRAAAARRLRGCALPACAQPARLFLLVGFAPTHENVERNRNFRILPWLLLRQPLTTLASAPAAAAAHWPPDAENQAAIDGWIATHGLGAFQAAAVLRGQHQFPDGLFFGGTAPTWSNARCAACCASTAPGTARTPGSTAHGLWGPATAWANAFACRDDAAALARACAWWQRRDSSISTAPPPRPS